MQFMPRLVSLLMDHLVNLEYSRSHDKATSKVLLMITELSL
jgi:hypothetical protein